MSALSAAAPPPPPPPPPPPRAELGPRHSLYELLPKVCGYQLDGENSSDSSCCLLEERAAGAGAGAGSARARSPAASECRTQRSNQYVESVRHRGDSGDSSSDDSYSDDEDLPSPRRDIVHSKGRNRSTCFCKKCCSSYLGDDFNIYNTKNVHPFFKNTLHDRVTFSSQSSPYTTPAPIALLDLYCRQCEEHCNFDIDIIIIYVKSVIDQLKRISKGEYLTRAAKERWASVECDVPPPPRAETSLELDSVDFPEIERTFSRLTQMDNNEPKKDEGASKIVLNRDCDTVHNSDEVNNLDVKAQGHWSSTRNDTENFSNENKTQDLIKTEDLNIKSTATEIHNESSCPVLTGMQHAQIEIKNEEIFLHADNSKVVELLFKTQNDGELKRVENNLIEITTDISIRKNKTLEKSINLQLYIQPSVKGLISTQIDTFFQIFSDHEIVPGNDSTVTAIESIINEEPRNNKNTTLKCLTENIQGKTNISEIVKILDVTSEKTQDCSGVALCLTKQESYETFGNLVKTQVLNDTIQNLATTQELNDTIGDLTKTQESNDTIGNLYTTKESNDTIGNLDTTEESNDTIGNLAEVLGKISKTEITLQHQPFIPMPIDELKMTIQNLNIDSVVEEDSDENLAIYQETTLEKTPNTKSPCDNQSQNIEDKKRRRLLEIRENRESRNMKLICDKHPAKHNRSTRSHIAPSNSVTKLSITNKAFYNSIFGQNGRIINSKHSKIRSNRKVQKKPKDGEESPRKIKEIPISRKKSNEIHAAGSTNRNLVQNRNRGIKNDRERFATKILKHVDSSLSVRSSSSVLIKDVQNIIFNGHQSGEVLYRNEQVGKCDSNGMHETKSLLRLKTVSNRAWNNKLNVSTINSITLSNESKMLDPIEESELLNDRKNSSRMQIECRESIDKIYDLIRKIGCTEKDVSKNTKTKFTASSRRRRVKVSSSHELAAKDSDESRVSTTCGSNSSLCIDRDEGLKNTTSFKGNNINEPKVFITSKNASPEKKRDNITNDEVIKTKRTYISRCYKNLPKNSAPLSLTATNIFNDFKILQKPKQTPIQDPRQPKIANPKATNNKEQKIQLYRLERNVKEKEENIIPKVRVPKITETIDIPKSLRKLLKENTDDEKEARGEAVRGPAAASRLEALAQPRKAYVKAHSEQFMSIHGRTIMADRLQRMVKPEPPSPRSRFIAETMKLTNVNNIPESPNRAGKNKREKRSSRSPDGFSVNTDHLPRKRVSSPKPSTQKKDAKETSQKGNANNIMKNNEKEHIIPIIHDDTTITTPLVPSNLVEPTSEEMIILLQRIVKYKPFSNQRKSQTDITETSLAKRDNILKKSNISDNSITENPVAKTDDSFCITKKNSETINKINIPLEKNKVNSCLLKSHVKQNQKFLEEESLDISSLKTENKNWKRKEKHDNYKEQSMEEYPNVNEQSTEEDSNDREQSMEKYLYVKKHRKEKHTAKEYGKEKCGKRNYYGNNSKNTDKKKIQLIEAVNSENMEIFKSQPSLKIKPLISESSLIYKRNSVVKVKDDGRVVIDIEDLVDSEIFKDSEDTYEEYVSSKVKYKVVESDKTTLQPVYECKKVNLFCDSTSTLSLHNISNISLRKVSSSRNLFILQAGDATAALTLNSSSVQSFFTNDFSNDKLLTIDISNEKYVTKLSEIEDIIDVTRGLSSWNLCPFPKQMTTVAYSFNKLHKAENMSMRRVYYSALHVDYGVVHQPTEYHVARVLEQSYVSDSPPQQPPREATEKRSFGTNPITEENDKNETGVAKSNLESSSSLDVLFKLLNEIHSISIGKMQVASTYGFQTVEYVKPTESPIYYNVMSATEVAVITECDRFISKCTDTNSKSLISSISKGTSVTGLANLKPIQNPITIDAKEKELIKLYFKNCCDGVIDSGAECSETKKDGEAAVARDVLSYVYAVLALTALAAVSYSQLASLQP